MVSGVLAASSSLAATALVVAARLFDPVDSEDDLRFLAPFSGILFWLLSSRVFCVIVVAKYCGAGWRMLLDSFSEGDRKQHLSRMSWHRLGSSWRRSAQAPP